MNLEKPLFDQMQLILDSAQPGQLRKFKPKLNFLTFWITQMRFIGYIGGSDNFIGAHFLINTTNKQKIVNFTLVSLTRRADINSAIYDLAIIEQSVPEKFDLLQVLSYGYDTQTNSFKKFSEGVSTSGASESDVAAISGVWASLGGYSQTAQPDILLANILSIESLDYTNKFDDWA